MKYLLLILGFMAVFTSGFFMGTIWERSVQSYEQALREYNNIELNYLILNMKVARNSHQYYIDNPDPYKPWYYSQEDWVIIYENIIELLEGLR